MVSVNLKDIIFSILVEYPDEDVINVITEVAEDLAILEDLRDVIADKIHEDNLNPEGEEEEE